MPNFSSVSDTVDRKSEGSLTSHDLRKGAACGELSILKGNVSINHVFMLLELASEF